jgi:hypothetical protein
VLAYLGTRRRGTIDIVPQRVRLVCLPEITKFENPQAVEAQACQQPDFRIIRIEQRQWARYIANDMFAPGKIDYTQGEASLAPIIRQCILEAVIIQPMNPPVRQLARADATEPPIVVPALWLAPIAKPHAKVV